MTSELVIKERSFSNGVILDLQGDVTKTAEEKLLHWRNWSDEASAGLRVVFNFTDVPYINSAGIAILIRIAQAAGKSGIMLYAFGVSNHYQKMFRLIGLNEFIMIFPDEYSLMQRLGAPE